MQRALNTGRFHWADAKTMIQVFLWVPFHLGPLTHVNAQNKKIQYNSDVNGLN